MREEAFDFADPIGTAADRADRALSLVVGQVLCRRQP